MNEDFYNYMINNCYQQPPQITAVMFYKYHCLVNAEQVFATPVDVSGETVFLFNIIPITTSRIDKVSEGSCYPMLIALN
jgi:hypothetical protein